MKDVERRCGCHLPCFLLLCIIITSSSSSPSNLFSVSAASAFDRVCGDMSKARVYPDINVPRPREYWDYEALTVQWGLNPQHMNSCNISNKSNHLIIQKHGCSCTICTHSIFAITPVIDLTNYFDLTMSMTVAGGPLKFAICPLCALFARTAWFPCLLIFFFVLSTSGFVCNMLLS